MEEHRYSNEIKSIGLSTPLYESASHFATPSPMAHLCAGAPSDIFNILFQTINLSQYQ